MATALRLGLFTSAKVTASRRPRGRSSVMRTWLGFTGRARGSGASSSSSPKGGLVAAGASTFGLALGLAPFTLGASGRDWRAGSPAVSWGDPFAGTPAGDTEAG